MINARKELEEILQVKAPVKCAVISNGRSYDDEQKNIVLKVIHNDFDYENFLNELDFDYDDGYGGQELYGTVWLSDGTWLSRGEYDGSEWWEHNVIPTIPVECLSNGI